MLLRVENLGKHFGGVRAVDELTFSLDAGAVHSIIGPNGAGKTTLFNLVTGVYRPSSGRILLDDEDVGGMAPFALAQRGVSRTFQNLQIFFNMTAIENVMVGCHLRSDTRLVSALLRLRQFARKERRWSEECAALMVDVGLAGYLDADSSSMPYGALKRLEIARALAAKPKLLLLDEPAAGLNPAETHEIDQLIRKIAADGVTVILVEHNMRLVMGVSDHILVLDYGRKLAEGTAAAIRANPDVIAAYLGSDGSKSGRARHA